MQPISGLQKDTAEENIYRYPINDLEYSERQLLSLCSYLKDAYRVIIAPSGPKPFTLISLIVALKMKEIDVWRISQGDIRNAVQYKASGKVSLYRVIFDYVDDGDALTIS
jgi:mRNA-degrading endonuclease RelE of RelBE toxin-antitoxin system